MLAAVAAATVGCTSGESASAESTTESPKTPPEDALRASAMNLDNLAAEGNGEAAWVFYSQRCKNVIGGLDVYEGLLDYLYADRTPDITDTIVRVNGSSAQVVTVDSDPSAPADSMEPRTWTFIDNRWQFDNC